MGLNPQQKEAVYSDESKILCLAGAGTGKTYCMIERIWRLVSQNDVDPSSILVLTFTNAAAFEMKNRYVAKVSGKFKQLMPEFRTFHSFCYLLLSIDPDIRSRLGFSSVPAIADPEAEHRMKIEAQMQLGYKLSDKKLSGKVTLNEKEQFQYETILKAYKRIMKKNNFITFDSLCYDVCKLFVDDEQIVQKYKNRFKYIFVDEFQDTDTKQYDFVRSFSGANLFVVGDALQSLYSFRGADSSIIKMLADNPLWKVIKLIENYRSCKCICDFANENTSYASDVYRVLIHSDKPGGSVNIQLFKNGYSKRGKIIDDNIKSYILSCKDMDGTTAIICRTNSEVADIQNILKENSIEYSSNNKDDSAVNILKSVSDNNFCMNWLSTYLDAYQYSEYIRQSTINSAYCLDDFLTSFNSIENIKDRWLKIDIVRRILKSRIDGKEKLSYILDLLNIGHSDTYLSVTSLSKLIELLESGDNGGNFNIYVGTVHSVKGLEYDNVILSGLCGPTFQLTNEENNNVYYVAITRAKTNLLILKGQSGVDYA